MATIVPAALKHGDTIAFVSPSFRLNSIFPELVARGKSVVEEAGFKVKVFYEEIKSSVIRDSIIQRCNELHAAFRDPEVKAVIATLGGSNANELLRHLDYDLVRANPKIFCGFSDITSLHFALFTQAGLQTFYGPAIISELAECPKPMEFTTTNLWHTLQHSVDKPLGSVPRSPQYAKEQLDFFYHPGSTKARELVPAPRWKWIRGGKGRGRIFGGCLETVQQLRGTPYWPDFQGRVLMLETAMGDKMTEPYPIVRSRGDLADLLNAGTFDDLAGLVIGRAYAHDETMTEQLEQTILQQLDGTSFPIFTNVDFGHTSPMITIPLNCMVELDSETDRFEFVEASVSAETKVIKAQA